MPAALALAEKWLHDSPKCDSLYGNAQTRQGVFNPITFAASFYSQAGNKYGGASFALLPLPVAAITEPLPPMVAGYYVTGYLAGVFINTITIPGLNAWNNGGTFDNAITLLHEMGHVYNFIVGSGGSQIKFDTLFFGSNANSDLVIKDCTTISPQ
jgi:hypothetical protein